MRHALLGALAMLSVVPGTARGAGQCQCDDLNNILQRLVEVRFLIKSFTDVYLDPANADTPWSRSKWGTISEPIEQQLNQFDQGQNPYPRSYTGVPTGSTNFHCEIELPKDVAPCILESLRRHETVHKLACEISARHHDNPFLDWQNYQTIAAAAEEDIMAYNAEVKFLTEEKQRLMCTCPYFGVQIDAKTDVNTPTVQASSTYQSGDTPHGVLIPLTLNPDGTFIGSATASDKIKANAMGCKAQSAGQVQFEAVGVIDGPDKATQMRLELTKDTIEADAGVVNCPPLTRHFSTHGGAGTVAFSMQAALDQSQTLALPLPTPGAIPTVTAKIVALPALEKQIQAAFPQGGSPPVFLPNCKNKP